MDPLSFSFPYLLLLKKLQPTAVKKGASSRAKPTQSKAKERGVLARVTRRQKEEDGRGAASAAPAAAPTATERPPTPTLGQQAEGASQQLSQSMPSQSTETGTDLDGPDTASVVGESATTDQVTAGREADGATSKEREGRPSVRDIVDEAEQRTQSAENADDEDIDGGINDDDDDDDDDESAGDNGGSAIMEIDDDAAPDAGSEERQQGDGDREEEEGSGGSSLAETETLAASQSQQQAAAGTVGGTFSTSSLPPTEKGKHHPCPRWGQTMTLIDHGRVLVYGGQSHDAEAGTFKTLSDLHVYDITTNKWSKPVNCEGVPRTWHSATFLPERQLLISFGGEGYNAKTKRVETTQEVMVLDTEIMLWYPPSVSGTIPSGRSGHTASLLPNTNELVVFGGVKNCKWQNSVAVLDTTRWKWSVPKIGGSAPRPRSYHTATAVGGTGGAKGGASSSRSRLVIFGGNDESESFNSVHVLDASGSKLSWFHPVVSGTPPSPRSGHCATLLEDNKTILIYGGWDLNAEEDEHAAAAAPSSDDTDMIFGDSYLLDTELWSWSPGPKAKYVGRGGAPNGGAKRVGHSAVLAPSEEGPAQVLVFGGRIPNDQFASDFQRLALPQSNVRLRCN